MTAATLTRDQTRYIAKATRLQAEIARLEGLIAAPPGNLLVGELDILKRQLAATVDLYKAMNARIALWKNVQ